MKTIDINKQFRLQNVALYSKGWYKRTDLFEDLKLCLLADGYTVFSLSDVLNIIVNATADDISHGRTRAEFLMTVIDETSEKCAWKHGYEYKGMPFKEHETPYNRDTAIIIYFLSMISTLGKSKTMDLQRPDPKVLPIREGANIDGGYEWSN